MHSIFRILDEATDSAGPDLISLADLKAALGIIGTDEDAALQAAITFQSRVIAEYCDRRFGRAEAVETFTFDPGETMRERQALVLTLYPVAEIAAITGGSGDAPDYELDPVTGRLWAANGGAWSGPVAVTYSGGYDLPEEAPARLSRAVIEIISETRASGGRDPTIREVSHGDTRISYFTSAAATASGGYLSASVADLVRAYRRLVVA